MFDVGFSKQLTPTQSSIEGFFSNKILQRPPTYTEVTGNFIDRKERGKCTSAHDGRFFRTRSRVYIEARNSSKQNNITWLRQSECPVQSTRRWSAGPLCLALARNRRANEHGDCMTFGPELQSPFKAASLRSHSSYAATNSILPGCPGSLIRVGRW
jgi:hypothetical protein